MYIYKHSPIILDRYVRTYNVCFVKGHAFCVKLDGREELNKIKKNVKKNEKRNNRRRREGNTEHSG